ncbi:unnamed protein product [Pleuronectes platessa]|uniref:Uncharacterized protein n=1 Tax=Pleuronectes platessa TaxID=8262 RepID=A0A9N7VVD8_PLEPL|nr:unnamed protein product [Pleuronectes platessa]
MHQGGDREELLSEELSGLQLGEVLQENEARLGRSLEAGLRLQRWGCKGVGVATSELEGRWRAARQRADSERTTSDRERRLSNRFIRDSAALSHWAVEAREMMSRWSQSGVAASEEMDVDQRHEHFLHCVALRKQLESRWDLKVSVIGAGSQLLQLREAVGHSDSNDSETSDPRLCSIVSQLRQTEADWSSLVAEVPVVQRALHQRWLEMLTQQGALQELQVWLGAAESRLQENHRTWSTLTDLQQNLRSFQECRVELSAHQATLDLVNQPSQTYSTESGQMGRYDHNQFAEDQGRLNHQWLCFQESLNSQIQELEQTLRSRAEREARLQQINIWITEQNLWMDSAQTPSSQTDLQRSLHRCQDLEEKIRQKAAALQELREKLCDGRGDDSFISQIEKSIQTCADLTQQVSDM